MADPKIIDIQSSFSDYTDAINKVAERIKNLTDAKKQAITEGNSQLVQEIDRYLKNAEGEKNTIQKILDIIRTMAKSKGMTLNDISTSQLKEQERIHKEFMKEQDEKVAKLNAFWGRFGYNFSNNDGNIEKGSFGEGFGSTKKVKETGEALSMFGGKIGKVGGVLTKFAGQIGIAIEVIKLLDKAIAAIADADAKQQDIQNRRNTMLTDRNIELSNIETEGNVDILNNFKDNMLSEYNQLFTKLQGQVAIANAKAIAATNAQIEGTIGDINNAAWNALAAQTDIWAQQQKLGLQVAKTNDIENRAIAQRNIELRNRQSERGYQSGQSILKAQRTNAELNMEEQNYTYDHPIATTFNKAVGGSTEADHVSGDKKWNEAHNRNTDRYLSNGVGGSALLGGVNTLTGGILQGSLKSAIVKQQTVTKRELTNAQNDLNAAQAENANRNKVQNTVIANSNEIKNKVLEGMTDIQSSVIDTQATIKKAYQKMAQSVEKWMMDFQDKIYDSGIQKGMTTRGQLDKYRSAMLPIMEEVSRKYGITKEEFVKMQSDYTAEGRSKLLNREDIKKQSSLGKIYLGGDFGTAAELANNTEIFNMGVSDTVDLMGEMSKQVNKIGLDGRKYLKDMVKNLKMAQKYDFRNGVKGMMKMAKWAQNTRFNMDNLPNMIEDIQKGGLEGIITKAAKLQVLGGRFAMGADPIAMAFEAYNDPAALAKRFNSMTMGMGRFNKETGEVEFNGMEMDQMRALAENSGQSIDDIKKQARYNVKKDKVEGFINDKTLSQEQRMDLVNKAYYQNGQWKVNDVTGNAVNLSEVNSSNINNIQADTYEGKMEQGMEQIVSFTKLFTGNTEANMAKLSGDINKNGAADNELWNRIELQQEDFHKNFKDYRDKVFENMKKATNAYKVFLNTFGESTPLDDIKIELSLANKRIDEFKTRTSNQLNSILTKLGVNEKGEKTNSANKLNKSNSTSQQYVKYNGSYMRVADAKDEKEADETIKKAHSPKKQSNKEDGVKSYFNNFKEGQKLAWARFTKAMNSDDAGGVYGYLPDAAGQILGNLIGLKATDIDTFWHGGKQTNKDKVKDGVMSSNGNSMFTQATNVTPINDGKVQIAKSDPKDTAVFAKTGGPFDTLFNDVFGRINDVYNEVHNETYSNTSSDVIPTEPLGKDVILAESPSISAQSINDGKVQVAKSDTKGTATFAKTGGPFDTLFNDVFGRINDVYNEVHNETYSNTSSDVIPTEPLGKDVILAESPSISAQSINDGKVQVAKSDTKGTATFAKTGGPFDTLFNDVYNEVHGNTSSDVIPAEPLGKDAIFAESPSMFTQSTEFSSANDGKVQIEPVNIKIDGKLELTGSNGQTVDIISELNNNPMLLRAISDMIVQNISTKYYGGRPVGNSNFRK